MDRILVWDVPVRLFHWLLAFAFGGAFLLATAVDDEGALFPVHAIAGLTAAFLIVLRVVWGIIGTRHARFSSFALHPAQLGRYAIESFSAGPEVRYAGHNPATSYFAVAMFIAIVGLGVTGVWLGRGSEATEEIHEILAWSAAALVVLHVAGIAWHTVRHRENIAASMITGRKIGQPAAAIASHRFGSAILLLLLTGAWSASMVRHYDTATRMLRLPIIGTSLTIGEAEGQEAQEANEAAEDDD